MDQQYMLALNRINGLGPAGIARLLIDRGGASDIFESPDTDRLRMLGFANPVIEQIMHLTIDRNLHRLIEADLRWLDDPHHTILHVGSAGYPDQLKHIHSPPPVLYVAGTAVRLSEIQIAMVGSRTCTRSGRELARQFARELSEIDVTVTSGLAIGIDGECHRGALEGSGKTIAVLGTGIDQIYPRRHRHLAESILGNGGALISEFPLGSLAIPAQFPRRNRIISGLSLGVLVVEARPSSGSLITANYALEQGREVFAVPGHVHSPNSQGCHQLIQNGAKLVQSIADIVEECPLLRGAPLGEGAGDENFAGLDDFEVLLIQELGYQALPIDCLVDALQRPVREILSALASLELKRRVVREPQGYRRINHHT